MSQPRLVSPGLRRIVMRDKDRFCIDCSLALFGPKYQFLLALLALNDLFRDCRKGRAGVL
jgi:hypothetical protein